ncbi:MAG: glycoside hydrolase family 3 C-terminal domain-containing protein [Acidobacteriota bacterium]
MPSSLVPFRMTFFRMRLLQAALILTCCPALSSAQQQYQYPFQNPDVPAEQRITDLLSRMTLDEKIDMLSNEALSAGMMSSSDVPRLGVVGTGHIEGLHGVSLGGPGHWQGAGKTIIPTTQFPQARGLGQTWDPALLEQAGGVEGFEARYITGRYHRGGLIVRAPNADLARDPRWGRSEESYGEDPYETGTMAVAYVKGLQGNNPHYLLSASLMKHFLANSNEIGRTNGSSNFDEQLFREYYSVPFRMAIEQAHVSGFMTAYNAWNGIPMAVQPVLKNVVIKEWGFDGIICSDGGAITNLVTQHHYYKTLPQAVAGAVHAGVNEFIDNYAKTTQATREAVAEGLLTEADIDTDLRGLIRVMIRLGLLDPASRVPYSGIGISDVDPAKGDPWYWQSHKDLARKATDESIVLLKDENKTLPLDASKLKSIAVIGPDADKVLQDLYGGTSPYAVSPLDGIRKRVGSAVTVNFASGSDLDQAKKLAQQSDVAIVIIGNSPTCEGTGWHHCTLPSEGHEGVDRTSLSLEQEQIAKEVFAANPHTIVVLNANFPYTTTWSQQHVPAILEMTHGSQEEGDGLADVLFGDYDPAGRLTETWVASMDQLPPMKDYDLRHGRTYMYLRQKPLYPFGYGLSYTTFRYSKLHLSSMSLRSGGTVNVKVNVSNTGQRGGDEVVQLYVTHLNSKVERPIEQLKGFDRIHLAPGETKTVSLPLTANSLRYWSDTANSWVLEPDQVEIRVGASSEDIRTRQTIHVLP